MKSKVRKVGRFKKTIFSVGECIKTKWEFYKANPKQLIIDAAGKTRKRGTR